MDIHSALTTLDYGVITVYIVAVLGLGFWVSLRKKHSDDFFLAGRSLKWGNIGLSIFGTNVAPSMLIASCAIAYTDGMVASSFEWLAWPFLMLLAMVFLPHYLSTRISTMPQFLERRYGEGCRRFLSYYAVFTTCISLGTTLFAGGILLAQIMNWPVLMCMLLLTLLATSFTIVGGLEAVTVTDSFQSILMIGASVLLTLIGLHKVGGLGELVQQVDPKAWQLFRPASDSTYPWHAIILGYPVMGIWFWCTNQVIVQRALGARNLDHSQKACAFAGYLKILTPLIFAFPGIICFILFPNLEDSNAAYMTMVTECLPQGLIGLIVAVLIAALVSTVDSQLNSLSTLFTMDIYCKRFKPNATNDEQKFIGRVVMAVGGLGAVLLGWALSKVEGMDLFSMIQSIIAFMAPSMAAVFLIGVLWKRATSAAALSTLVIGNAVSIGIGICYLAKWPVGFEWPHFLLLSFYLFCALSIMMVVVSLCTQQPEGLPPLPSLRESCARLHEKENRTHANRILWVVLAVIMVTLYALFEWAARGDQPVPLPWQEQAVEFHQPSLAPETPQIAAISETTFPGETLVITGTGLDAAELLIRAKNKEIRIKPLFSSEDRIIAEIPGQFPLAAAVVWPVKGDLAGAPIRINAADIWWHWPLEPTPKTRLLHLMGRNLNLKGADSRVLLQGPDFNERIKVAEANPYKLTLQLPDGLRPGDYTIRAGNGSALGWSEPVALKIAASPGISERTVSAKDFGAVADDGEDDSKALASAVAALADGGGTLVLEQGTYLLSTPLILPGAGISVKGAGAGKYNSEGESMGGVYSLLKYFDVNQLPKSVVEIRAPNCGLSSLAVENGNNGDDQSAVAVYAPFAEIHGVTLIMQDKRDWGFSEPGPNFGTAKGPGPKCRKVIDSGTLFVDSPGNAGLRFQDSEVHAVGPGILVGEMQAYDLEKENEPSSNGILIENVEFTGYYAGEPNENTNPGGSGRAVGVVLYNAKNVMVQNSSFRSADRANRKIMCRTVLSVNTSSRNFYLADNHSINIGSHPTVPGMDPNQGEQYLFHYRYPYGGLFDVVQAASDSVTLDPTRAEPFKADEKFTSSHYFHDDRGSRVLDEVGKNDHWIVFICDGKGVGQYRKVAAQEKAGNHIRLVLEKPWRIVPDATSRFNLTTAIHHVVVYRNYADTGEWVLEHKTHGVTFWFYAFDNVVAENHFKNMTSGIVFNSRFRGPTAWNLTKDNVVENISGYCGDTSLEPAGYVDHFRVTLEWPTPDDRVWYSVGNIARSNRFDNVEVGAYLHARFTGQVWGGLPSVPHENGGMVMSILENNTFSNVQQEGIVVATPANNCLIRENRVGMSDPAKAENSRVVEACVQSQNIVEQ